MTQGSGPLKLKWDGTINAGHVLIAVSMFIAGLVWGLRLENLVAINERDISRNAVEISRVEDRVAARLTSMELRLTSDINTLSESLENLNSFLRDQARGTQ